MRTQPSLDKHRIRSPEDAREYSAGIPSTHWGTNVLPKTFRSYKIAESLPVTTSDKQLEVATSLTHAETPTIFSVPHLVYVCIHGHESLAMGFAYTICRRALTHSLRIQIDNAATFSPEDGERAFDESVAVLVNASTQQTSERRQRVRDWVYAYEASFRVLVITGEPAEVVEHLGIRPTMAFFLSNVTTVSV